STTIRTARSRTSGENLFVVLLVMASSSQELRPPANPARFNRTVNAQDVEAARQYLLRPESAQFWDIAKSKTMQADLIAWGKGRPDRQEMAAVFVRVFSGLKLAASRSAEEGRSLFRQSLCAAVNCEIASRPAAIEATPR
ncbi:hypothetical protein, partial [Caulobacter sp. DWR1-3-2b1]|uniref:hypothetical protein n=1 Tax=Caulobacter sp. DWR1-3-2b1 TaxID=2804670 RepID=UPI003CF846D4